MCSRESAHRAVSVVAGVAVLLSLASVAPSLLHRGFPVGHDTTAHLTYVYLFDAALAQGQFPVRWVGGIRPGHSQPLFSFYQPGFYYAVQLVHTVVPSLLLATKLTILGAWWSGSAFAYLSVRSLGRWPAAAAAVLFMRAPYLILDVFVRAAFPEFLALTCAPAVLWSLDRTLRTGRPGYALTFSAASAAMVLCHLPTVLMFVPMFVTYAAYLCLTGACSRTSITAAIAGTALAAGLACFYVAPALLELHLTRIRELTSAYFDYRLHFVEPSQWFRLTWGYGGSEAGPADTMSFQVGLVQWIAVGVGAAALVIGGAARSRRGWMTYWLCITGAALLMTSAGSAAIWKAVPPLAFIQFPWRFLSVVSLAVAVVSAFALSSIARPAIQAAVVLLGVIGLWWQTQALLKPSQVPAPCVDVHRQSRLALRTRRDEVRVRRAGLLPCHGCEGP